MDTGSQWFLYGDNERVRTDKGTKLTKLNFSSTNDNRGKERGKKERERSKAAAAPVTAASGPTSH